MKWLALTILAVTGTIFGFLVYIQWRGMIDNQIHDRQRLEVLEQFALSRSGATPQDVLDEIQRHQREIMDWLRDHAVTCEPCPPCQTGDDDEVPGS